jgi:hypothetical protein
MTGKEFRQAIDCLIGDRRRQPINDDQWRIRYGKYEPMDARTVAKRVKKIGKRWKKRLQCIWSAETMRGALQDWAAQKGYLPITVAAITSTYMHGNYHEYGHRYLILLDHNAELWLIEPLWSSLPWEEMCFPLSESDDDFWDLHG